MHERAMVVVGDGSALQVAHQVLALQAGLGAPACVVDCGGSFDPYVVARYAQRKHQAPGPVLERIQVARAFTAYQELALLRAVARRGPEAPLFVLNPVSLLLDPDLPAADRGYLLDRFVRAFHWMTAQGYTLRLCQLDITHEAIGATFQARLMAGFPTLLAREGQLMVVDNGKVRRALQPSRRPGARTPGTVPPRAA